jgi:hypothetical protein
MREPQLNQPLPDPSAELVLIRIMLEAHLDGLPAKERAKFVRRINESFAERLDLGNIEPLRPPTQFSALKAAQLQAHAWFCKAMSARMMRAG